MSRQMYQALLEPRLGTKLAASVAKKLTVEELGLLHASFEDAVRKAVAVGAKAGEQLAQPTILRSGWLEGDDDFLCFRGDAIVREGEQLRVNMDTMTWEVTRAAS